MTNEIRMPNDEYTNIRVFQGERIPKVITRILPFSGFRTAFDIRHWSFISH